MSAPPRQLPVLIAALAALAVSLALAPLAPAAMRSTKISPGVCKTVGGGKFVELRRFPGEWVDRRLRRDIRWMANRFEIFITDGYSTSPSHAWNGEHPIGLALDIVPNRARGGTWAKITRLARRAEPRQNRPRAPWRWVGYNGDPGHGRGHHLHLSYMHSETKPKVPARVAYTHRCPRPPKPPSTGTGSTGGTGSGGVSAKQASPLRAPALGFGELAPVVPEAAGTDLAGAR